MILKGQPFTCSHSPSHIVPGGAGSEAREMAGTLLRQYYVAVLMMGTEAC